jgi:hypothetical protein
MMDYWGMVILYAILAFILSLPFWIWQAIKSYKRAYNGIDLGDDEIKTAKVRFVFMLIFSILAFLLLVACFVVVNTIHC